jgi:hypothetical protein
MEVYEFNAGRNSAKVTPSPGGRCRGRLRRRGGFAKWEDGRVVVQSTCRVALPLLHFIERHSEAGIDKRTLKVLDQSSKCTPRPSMHCENQPTFVKVQLGITVGTTHGEIRRKHNLMSELVLVDARDLRQGFEGFQDSSGIRGLKRWFKSQAVLEAHDPWLRE